MFRATIGLWSPLKGWMDGIPIYTPKHNSPTRVRPSSGSERTNHEATESLQPKKKVVYFSHFTFGIIKNNNSFPTLACEVHFFH